MKFSKLKITLLVLSSLIAVSLTSCVGTRTLMMTAPNKPSTTTALPILPSISLETWESQKAGVWKTLQDDIYGALPQTFIAKKVSSRPIDSEYLNASVTEVVISSDYKVDEVTPSPKERNIEFNAVIITPSNTDAPSPIIMMENFCPNHNVVPLEGISKPRGDYFSCDGEGLMSKIFGYFFGRYITTPPIQMIIDQGYALAVIYPSETFPDRASDMDIHSQSPNKTSPWGTVGAWAWQFSVLSNYLDQDGRFSNTIAYGHSRYGKSALVAAAYDTSIDAVIAHQSGTGGASLSKGKPGETVSAITSQYPHWFTPSFKEERLTLDQHHLLALIAPRPIFLGNAKRDVWSDPEGAFRAAQGATPIYELYNSKGLRQTRLDAFDPNADIAFWMRRGTHGVVKEDWPAFLEFIDAHF